jgi:hypothetical protein
VTDSEGRAGCEAAYLPLIQARLGRATQLEVVTS